MEITGRNAPIIFQNPPRIPAEASGVVLYKLLAKEYNNRMKQVGWLFIQLVATLLVIGILWITIDWVKITVTVIALALSFILILILLKFL